MKIKEYVSDYNTIASKFIRDERLSLEIQQNISFVENYLDEIENVFDEEIEREIAYRELGIIVHSCIEALTKSVLFEINERCKKNKTCGNKLNCKYRKYKTLKGINDAKIVDIVPFLINTRLFLLYPDEMDELTKLNAKRNYVHISKKIGKKELDLEFDKEYPCSLLKHYYNLLNQLDICGFYFDEEDTCLKELDNDDYDYTDTERKRDNSHYYLMNFINAMRKYAWREALSKEDETDLRRYNFMDESCQKDAVRYTLMVLRPTIWRIKDDNEYSKAKDKVLNELVKIVSKKFVNEIENEI